MATEEQVRAAIKATMESAAGIGPVHDRLRYTKNTGALADLYKNITNGRLNGWTFYRESMRLVEIDTGLGRRLDNWRIYAHMAIDDADASNTLLQTQVEAVRAALMGDRTLGGLVLDLKDMNEREGRLGMQIEIIEPWMFAGVLTLRARCLMLTETEEPVSP